METTNQPTNIIVDQLPALQHSASCDELRPAMCYIAFQWNDDNSKLYCVTTNAHILVYFDFLEFIPENQKDIVIDSFPTNFYIHADYFKPLTDKNNIFTTIKNECLVVNSKGGKQSFVPYLTESEFHNKVGIYPNWNAVIPTGSSPIESIGFDLDLLSKLSKTLKLSFSKPVKFQFLGSNKPVQFSVDFVDREVKGIIMPMIVK